MVSEIDTEPRLFGAVPRETQLVSVPSCGVAVEKLHVGRALHLLLLGLVAVAIVGVFFGGAFFLLAQPKNQTFVPAAPASPAVKEEAVTTAENTPAPGDAAATITAAEQAATTPASASGLPNLPTSPPQVSSSPAAGPPGKAMQRASGGRRSHVHLAARRYRSGHHPQSDRKELGAQAEKQRILSAAMDRAHGENFSDPFQSLTPPQPGQKSPFDQLITHLTGRTNPTPSLTPPRAEQP